MYAMKSLVAHVWGGVNEWYMPELAVILAPLEYVGLLLVMIMSCSYAVIAVLENSKILIVGKGSNTE